MSLLIDTAVITNSLSTPSTTSLGNVQIVTSLTGDPAQLEYQTSGGSQEPSFVTVTSQHGSLVTSTASGSSPSISLENGSSSSIVTPTTTVTKTASSSGAAPSTSGNTKYSLLIASIWTVALVLGL
ncbi:hypothetical protein CAAN1_16S01090 [[Candida] anglica]|uniref:Uncharacterized protein n=1 Tax=[Candida] anglica TaxID=148631 RepID=A0ABP0EBM6_9ASCO